mmetsp:Transcript_62885/g.149917  ORF Transcript_62885/g.149917 Transcript_62885/m.149917 type:complete len:97 (-) Transcript_62885:78-368(-)
MSGLLKNAMRFRTAAGTIARMPQPSTALAARFEGATPKALSMPRCFATYKSASPETPLMHYQATQQAQSSMNHRLFWVNWLIIIVAFDIASGMLDV